MPKNDQHWLGFDLGGTKMLAVVFDQDLRQVGKKRKKTVGRGESSLGMDRIVDVIAGAAKDAGVSPGDLQGIGIGCPGPLDLDRGIVLDAPNLGWRDVPVKQRLEDEFGCPVAVLNDVDAGVFAEYSHGAAQDARCVLGVFPGTGIGGGCVYRGEVLSGAGLSCMEIGHIQVLPDGPICGCGHRGCLETVASRLAVAAAAATAAYRGKAPHLLKASGTDLRDIRSGALASAIAAGDTEIEEIVRYAASQIGVAVAGIVNLIAPDVVVLGGGLVEAMPELYTSSVLESARARVMRPYVDTFRVVASQLGDDAVPLGAAAWARYRLGTAPAKCGS